MEIVICPVLGSLRSKSLLTDTKESAQSHLLPWSETESYRKPILVATVPGSIVAVNRISPRLFEFLLHLQDVLLYHDPFMFYDFDLLRDKLSITHVIYGDLIALYIRLPLEQQQKIFQDIQMEDEQSLRSLAQSILGVSDESLRERTTVDLLCEIIQILLDQYWVCNVANKTARKYPILKSEIAWWTKKVTTYEPHGKPAANKRRITFIILQVALWITNVDPSCVSM